MVAFWKDGEAADRREPPAEHLRNARQLVQLMVVDAVAEGNRGGQLALEALELRLTKAGEQADAVHELAKAAGGVRISDIGLLERVADREKHAGSAADAARLLELAQLVGSFRLWRDAVLPFWKVSL